MATIKQKAVNLLNDYGWRYDQNRRSPAWIDPKGRTNNGIYLGERGSIRYGYSKTESRPVGGNGSLENLERYLMKIRDTPLPEPLLEQIKRENPVTIARRNVHAIVQQLTLEQLEQIQKDYGGAS